MKQISIDNGAHFVTLGEALEAFSMETIAIYMDDQTREAVHLEFAPTDLEFLTRYLEFTPTDLIIG